MGDYARYETEAAAWVASVSKQKVESIENDLKNGVVLCALINNIRPNTILKVNNYNAAFRQMENIDNFRKVSERLGVEAADLFQTEDLYYGNNIPKVVLTLFVLAKIVKEQFGNVPDLDESAIPALREIAASAQKEGKKRATTTQLSLFELGAQQSQKQASAASRTADRMIHGNEKSVDTSGTLGFIDTGSVKAQQMISSAMRSGTDNIIKSNMEHHTSAELGLMESNAKDKQAMISSAKRNQTDNIIKSRDQAVASSELGMMDASAMDKQSMISSAKRNQTDNIIKSRDQAVASSELGMMDASAMDKQSMISSAKKNQTDNIIKSRDQSVATSELGLLESHASGHQAIISDAKKNQLDQIIRNPRTGDGEVSLDE